MSSDTVMPGSLNKSTTGGIRAPQLLIASLVLVDSIALIAAFSLAYLLRFRFGLSLHPEFTRPPEHYAWLVLSLLPLWLVIFALMRLYDRQILLGGTDEYFRIFNAVTTGMMVVVLATFLDVSFVISRVWLLLSWFFSGVFVASGRFSARRVAYHFRAKGYFVEPVFVVGTNGEALALANQLAEGRHSGMEVLGLVSTGEESYTSLVLSNQKSIPVLGHVPDLPRLIEQLKPSRIIVAATSLHRSDMLDIYTLVAPRPDLTLQFSSGLFEVLATGMEVSAVGTVPLISLKQLRLDRMEIFIKTCLDLAGSIVLVLLLSPLLALLAVMIKLESPGPVIHRRRVLGTTGKAFDAFKFRTMVVNGDDVLADYPALQEELAKTHKIKDDPRITKVGRWIRRTSLDELPQLFNVLRGQMSLVGPRMITPQEADMYGRMRYNLLTVKPGITGLWQVSGRSNLSYEERVRLDMYYVRNYTIWLDLQILFIQTLPAVIRRQGAY